MNPLERKVANLIDNKDAVIWWTRNISADKQWYCVKGWKKGRIFPDFVVAKRKKNNSLELVYVIESKGEHLIGNADTIYKQAVFRLLNKSKIEKVKISLKIVNLNNKYQYELVEQGKEETTLNKYFNY